MTVINTTQMTAQQFLLMGQDPPGVRLELINGEIGVAPSPSFEHSRADSRLRRLLLNFIIEHDLGELVGDVDTIFDPFNVRRPDILFIAKERMHLLSGKFVDIAPDLCIEVLSPSSVTVDSVDKFALYAKHGVQHYWLIDTEAQSLKAYTLKNGEYELTSQGTGDAIISPAPFEGLELPLADLWLPR